MNPGLPALFAALSVVLMVAVATKWKLSLRLSLVTSVAIGLLVGVPFVWIYPRAGSTTTLVVVALAQIAATLFIGMLLVQWRFWRDPERVSPADPGLILSAADGRVIYVRSVEASSAPLVTKSGRDYSINELLGTDLLETGAFVIGVEMNILNVHVNRCPIPGRTQLVRHIEGTFISLGKDEAPFRNARCTTVIDTPGLCVATVQVASRLVRRVENYLSVGQMVTAGQRLGRIRFGSLVAIVVPMVDHVTIEIKPGDEVVAGVSVLARYPAANNESPV